MGYILIVWLLVGCQFAPTRQSFPEEERLQQLLIKQEDTICLQGKAEPNKEKSARFDRELQQALQQHDTATFMKQVNQWGLENFFTAAISLPLEQRKQILQAYHATDSLERMHDAYQLGIYYAYQQQPDSMQHYMLQAIDLAHKLHSNNNAIHRNYADMLNAIGRSREALPVMRLYDQLYPPRHPFDRITRAATYVCLWLNLGQSDSAAYYQQQLEAACNQLSASDFNHGYQTSIVFIEQLLRTHCDQMEGKPLNMIDIYRFAEHTAKINRQQKQQEEERLIIQNLLERKNLHLQIEKRRSQQLLFFLLFSALCLILFLAYLYQRKLLIKERFIQQMKQQIQQHRLTLTEKEQQIRQNEASLQQLSQLHSEQEEMAEQQLSNRLEEMEQIRIENEVLRQEMEQLQQEMNDYTNQLADKDSEMDSFERLSEQNQLLLTSSRLLTQQLIAQNAQLRAISKGEVKSLEAIDWNGCYKQMDKLFNRYTERLRNDFPALTEEDIQCCCFIKLQMSNAAIARLFNIAPSSVTKRKQRIKERINQSKEGRIGKEQPVDVYLGGF